MTDDRNRDRQLEQALARELRRAEMVEPGGECLDAETLAAWMDGGLGRDAVTLMEAHAAGCPRCRAMIAAYTEASPADVPAAESPLRLWRWWLAPIAAATAATVLWIVVPSSDRPTMSAPAPVAEVASPRQEPVAVAPAESDRAAEKAPATPPRASVAEPDLSGTLPKAPPNARGRGDARQADTANQAFEAARQRADEPRDQREARLERSAADAKQDAVAAPPPAAAAEPALRRAFAAEAVIVAAAESPVRWRATSGGIDRSSDAGQTWQRVADAVNGVIIAGSAPSADVCWMVGRAGAVLLTTDARTFTRVPFPEPVDLVLVSASGPRVASVTAADGRVFETSDAGLTWRRR